MQMAPLRTTSHDPFERPVMRLRTPTASIEACPKVRATVETSALVIALSLKPSPLTFPSVFTTRYDACMTQVDYMQETSKIGRMGLVGDLWIGVGVLLFSLAVDVAGLFERSGASVAAQVAFLVGSTLVGAFRLVLFFRSPTPETYEQLRESQARLLAGLDLASLLLFVSVDVLMMLQVQPSLVVYLSSLGGVIAFRSSQVSAESRMRIAFHEDLEHPGHLTHQRSLLHGSLVAVRVTSLVSTFFWSGVGVVSVVADRALLVVSVVLFAASIGGLIVSTFVCQRQLQHTRHGKDATVATDGLLPGVYVSN